MTRLPALLAWVAWISAAVLAMAPAAAQEMERIGIGYLELADDPRYDEDRVYARIVLRPLGRSMAAAEVALDEARTIAQFLGKEFFIERHQGQDVDDLVNVIDRWVKEKDIRFYVLDLPWTAVRDLSARTRGKDIILFNATAPENSLRNAFCQPHLMHTMPSHAMQADALMQYLLSKKWRQVLLLEGPLPEDALIAQAFEHSAKKFGVRILEKKPFKLSNDPRIRAQNNVALMTAVRGYDVVIIADSDGEFGRYVPYQTNLPRPVVGTTGLVPQAWHWSFERYGAPQLNSRFERKVDRRMTGQDWGVWVAVKAVVTGVTRARPLEYSKIVEFIKSARMRLDGFKGPALNFRPWNNQLRQPVLLATHNAIIEKAPLDAFLHAINDLDTLGDDQPDTTCTF